MAALLRLGVVLLVLVTGCAAQPAAPPPRPKTIRTSEPGSRWNPGLLIDLECTESPLEEVLEGFSKRSGVRVFLDPLLEKELRERGESPTVTLRLRQIPIANALDLVIAVAFDTGGYGYWEDSEGVRVGTPDAYFLEDAGD